MSEVTRRSSFKYILGGVAVMVVGKYRNQLDPLKRIRLGGPVDGSYSSPEEWVQAHKNSGYSAAYCPLQSTDSNDVVQAYAKAAKTGDLLIAEVGAWSNPLSPDENERKKAIAKCCQQLDLAERIGARCCVNISGSRGQQWDGPNKLNLTEETFEMIVSITRSIIDQVKPKRTFFTLETMPWAYPDSVESYVRLLKAIDRPAFAVHFDPVNLICSPQRYYSNGSLIKECFRSLGPFIKSCHAKDILLQPKLTTHLDEVRPGLGGLDYQTFLRELSQLPEVPLMLEHLKSREEYDLAGQHIRQVAESLHIHI
jgi:sugar phosphate isomerase/epimerase